MKKSIFLFFAAILCAIGMNAATVTSDGTARLYFNMSTINWWVASNGNGNFGYFFNNSTGKNAWSAHSVKHDGNTYYVVIPKGTWTGVILTRNNTSTAPSWDNKWNQTGDITLSSTSNYISKFSEGSTTVTWGTAVKPASTAKVSSAASTIYVGASTTLTPSLTSNADINDIKSTTYTISPATGASISGNTFTASAEGTYTITATVTYHPDGYSDTKLQSTATATTTIKAEVPAEETHDVTVSYMCGETKLQDPTTVNTVGVEKSVKVTAPEIAKYTFVNWTLGADVATTDALTSNEINITTEAGGSDFTLVANYEKAKLTYTVTVPAGTENCYLVGAMNGWNVANPIEMTKQGENVFTTTLEGVATTDEYKYLSQKGTWDYEEVGGNRTWSANDVVTAWKDPLATNVYLAGEMNGWSTTANEFKKAAKDDASASIILNLTAGTYKFKVVDNGAWLGNNSTIDKTISGWTFAGDKGDCPLKATIAGDYTFTWAISTKKLSVTYPTICAITATVNDAAMGTIAGAGDHGKGSTATLTATPNDGYLFVNWTKGGEVVATTQEYSFTVTEAVALVANFEAAPEEVHNVTVSYLCGGNKIADDQTVAAVGETSAKTAEAPAIFGYTFDSWTLGADVTTTNELTSNTIDINIVAGGSDYTLTANYTEIPKVTVYFVNNKKWSKVNAYGWKDGEAQGTPAWPGKDITASKETEQVADFDVYSYSVVPGSYDNIIFNNGSGTQTETFKWTDGKYYYMDAANNYTGGTKEEVEKALVDVYTIMGAGELGLSWDLAKTGNDMTKQADGTYTLVKEGLDLATTGNYEYKVVKNHSWDWSIPSGNTNQTLKVDKDGTYTVTFTLSADKKKLTADAVCTAEKEVILDCFVAGTINLVGGTSDFTDKLAMTYDEGTKTYSKTFTALAAGDYQMKVVYGSDWLGYDKLTKPVPANVTEGDDKKIKFSLAEAGDVTVTYHATNGIGLTGNFAVPAPKYYIAGSENLTGFNWKENGLQLTKDGDFYKHTFSALAAGIFEFKVTDGQWNTAEDKTHEWGYSNLGAAYEEVSEGTDGEGNPNGNIKFTTEEAKNITVIFDGSKITFEGLTEKAPTLVTPSVEKGIFSVGEGKFVQFSTGNLQYNVGTNTWSFAANQYDYIGEDNINVGDPTFTGTIDMFGWSADGKFGVNPSNKNEDYNGDFVDWGTLVNEADWCTLSADDWKYLLNTRANAANLKQIAKVGSVVGIMLFPDVWTMPADVNVTAAYDNNYEVNIYNYTLDQWTKLEEAGAVFLPAAGRRAGGYGNKINYDQVEENNPANLNGEYYRWQDNTNIYCYYWTSTINETTKNVSYLHNMVHLGGDNYTIGTGAIWGEKGRYGQSVRLVKKATPDYTREVTSGDYGTICLPNGGLLFGASAFSVAKMEGTTILLYEVGTTMVGGTPYVVFPNTGASNLYVFYTDNEEAPAGNANGLYGSYTREELAPNAGNYIMLPGNKYAEVTGDRVYVGKNRAYFKVSEIPTTAPAPAPGVRRIAIGQAPQVATGMENVDASAQPVKTIINGQLFILRGEKMYDAQGKLVK